MSIIHLWLCCWLPQELERHPSGALPGPMVKSVAWQLLHALAYCHERQVRVFLGYRGATCTCS